MSESLVLRAVKTRQGGVDVFAFFMPGSRLLELAEISRISRDSDGSITGFQRPEIRSHVRGITEYLNRGDVLFPNAIVLALAPGTRFVAARGTKPARLSSGSDVGTLSIAMPAGQKAAWIVDGQQRALALAESTNKALLVPVVAFVTPNLSIHREQFVLVNKARPLSPRLIDELLPEVGALLPRDLSVRRVPSALCSALNESGDSPFRGLIRRPSLSLEGAVITDSVLTRLMRRSLADPRGALAAHMAPDGTADLEAMYRVMVAFWTAVRDAFPDAWGLPPDRSRLMHAAGLSAMGVLMDEVMTRAGAIAQGYNLALNALRRIAPFCRWTSGRWDVLNREWNDIECTTRDVRTLSNLLVSLERDSTWSASA